MDKPGKDWRHAKAGADTVIISGHDKVAMIKKTDYEWELDQLIKLSSNVDLFLVEGFKHSDKPKIEVFVSIPEIDITTVPIDSYSQ